MREEWRGLRCQTVLVMDYLLVRFFGFTIHVARMLLSDLFFSVQSRTHKLRAYWKY